MIIRHKQPNPESLKFKGQFKSITLGSYCEEMSSSPLIYLHPSLSTEDRVVSSIEGVANSNTLYNDSLLPNTIEKFLADLRCQCVYTRETTTRQLHTQYKQSNTISTLSPPYPEEINLLMLCDKTRDKSPATTNTSQ